MQHYEILDTAGFDTNDPRRESCEAPGCDQLASYRLLTVGGTPAGLRHCEEHAAMHAHAFGLTLPVSDATIAEIGKRFVTILEEWLTPAEFEEVRTRNDAETDSNVCHSHDFCDANMAMEEAWRDVINRTPGFAPENDDPEYDAKVAASEADSVLWGRAWNWAIEHYLSHSSTAVALEEEGFPEA